jgi:hypothetical protein
VVTESAVALSICREMLIYSQPPGPDLKKETAAHSQQITAQGTPPPRRQAPPAVFPLERLDVASQVAPGKERASPGPHHYALGQIILEVAAQAPQAHRRAHPERKAGSRAAPQPRLSSTFLHAFAANLGLFSGGCGAWLEPMTKAVAKRIHSPHPTVDTL